MSSAQAPSDPRRPARHPWVRAGLLVGGLGALVAALLAGLALIDVIPGGWRLRTLIVPQSVQEQRRRAGHRSDRLEVFAAEAPPQPGGTLFIGSSTVERFPLAELLPELAPINRGIGDEDLDGLEARAVETATRLQPKTVVLYAGSVNVRRAVDDGSWTPAPEIVSRTASLARDLLGLPTVEQIVLLGILPERETGPELHARLDAVNAGLGALAASPGIVFLAMDREPLLDSSGNLRPGVSADALHLNSVGYQAVAQWVKAALDSE